MGGRHWAGHLTRERFNDSTSSIGDPLDGMRRSDGANHPRARARMFARLVSRIIRMALPMMVREAKSGEQSSLPR
nr:hypothetical protein CFP56_59715 [Quercus suber]